MTDTNNVLPVNPLMQKLQMPGRIFKLPSGGFFYNNGELADTVKDGEVHIHPISAIAEIYLKNPDMLFSGKAIEKVFSECVPDIKKPNEMFGRDVDAIMCFLRMVTYGTVYEVSAKHDCENAKSHVYDIDLEQLSRESLQLDPTTIKDKYSTALDNGQVVELEPIRFKHVIQMLQNIDRDGEKMTALQIETGMIDNTLNTIKAVDGITDKKMIEQWLRGITATQMNRIAELIDTSNDWGFNYVRDVACKDCNEHFNLELPVNPVSFFSE